MTKENSDLLNKAITTVNLFDQANTGCMIENLGYRGKILAVAINDLRDKINEKEKLTILTIEQAKCKGHQY